MPRIIHLQRNPIDTCLSIYFHLFSIGHTYAHDLEDLAHYSGEYSRIMAYWRSLLPRETLLEVPYEGREFSEKLLPLCLVNILENRPLPIHGDGLQIRDRLYVTDHCRAIDTILASQHKRACRFTAIMDLA